MSHVQIKTKKKKKIPNMQIALTTFSFNVCHIPLLFATVDHVSI